jgi:SMI1 / KNR4 family (SUKH-1)
LGGVADGFRGRQLSADPLGSGDWMNTPFDQLAEYLVRLYGETGRTNPPRPSLFKRLFGAKAPPAETWLVAALPASASQIEAFEHRYGVSLPPDVVSCYRRMNGSPEYTDIDAAWMRFWPIEEWKPVSEEFPTDPDSFTEPLSSSFTCADHGISAWFFAIDLAPSRLGTIYSIETPKPRQVASSFSGFVSMVLAGSKEPFNMP